MNPRVLAMLIKNEVSPGFHYYILRVMNQMTHANSIVYRDYLISNVSECVSINIEEDNSDSSIITFSILCDSTILVYLIQVKENLKINVMHEYWSNPNNMLIVNVTQSEVYNGTSSSTQIPLKVERNGI